MLLELERQLLLRLQTEYSKTSHVMELASSMKYSH